MVTNFKIQQFLRFDLSPKTNYLSTQFIAAKGNSNYTISYKVSAKVYVELSKGDSFKKFRNCFSL